MKTVNVNFNVIQLGTVFVCFFSLQDLHLSMRIRIRAALMRIWIRNTYYELNANFLCIS